MQKLYGLGDIMRMTGILRHRIVYALQAGYLPEPSYWLSNKRAWTQQEFEDLAGYFNVKIDWSKVARFPVTTSENELSDRNSETTLCEEPRN